MPVLAINGDAGFGEHVADTGASRRGRRAGRLVWVTSMDGMGCGHPSSLQDEILGDDRIAINMKVWTGPKLAEGGNSGLAVQAMS